MRALLGMLLFSMVGCDSLWASYIGLADIGVPDAGVDCALSGTCPDLAGADLAETDGSAPPPDLQLACKTSAMCVSPMVCDLNIETCIEPGLLPDPTMPFPLSLETSVQLTNHYLLMSTGDYNNDGMTDVAVSGLFTGPINATGAAMAPVIIYLNKGDNTFIQEACPLPATEAPVYLLTAPIAGKPSDILVATFSNRIYRCTRNTGSWAQTTIATNITAGFKQIALTTLPGYTMPDLMVHSKDALFQGSSTTGRLFIRRNAGNNTYDKLNGEDSLINDGTTWGTPFRFFNATTDVVVATRAFFRNVTFESIAANDTVTENINPIDASTGGTPFPQLSLPFSATVPIRLGGRNGLLFTYSQTPNAVSVLYAGSIPAFAVEAKQTMMMPTGLMLPYAGDGNGDLQDEIGLYTTALNSVATPTRSLQLWSYKAMAFAGKPMVQIDSTSENFRAMSLEHVGNLSDLRRGVKRKDLITLVEDPVANTSRLRIRRANLNAAFP